MNCRTRKSARDTSVADEVFKLSLLPQFFIHLHCKARILKLWYNIYNLYVHA